MKKRKKAIAAGFLAAAMTWNCLAVFETQAQEPGKVSLEKTAHWTDEENYQAEIDLTAEGIEKYTADQVPVSIIPVLDVTASMEYCDTPGHTAGVLAHPVSAFEDSLQVWEEILPTLPDLETYQQMGEEDPNQLFLTLPESIDPDGKCRLVCRQYGESDSLDFDQMAGWRVVYVTDDQSLLPGLRDGVNVGRFSHTLDYGGIYLPVGEMMVFENRVTWAYESRKSERAQCEKNRMEHLQEGYSQFLEAVFQDMKPQICPVAFGGGYFINGWTQSQEEARDFLVNKEYLNKEAVLPAQNTGTNHEAAVWGALDAAADLENTENTFVILFTDGTTTAGYSHESGTADLGLLDSHSYGLAGEDSSWYGQYAQWALEDAQQLKEKIPVYAVGYGSDVQDTSDCQAFIEALSSGEEYYIDTRREDMQDIGSIFQAIYSDLSWKAVKVRVTDYVSEYWDVAEEELPMGAKAEKIGIVNQRGEEDTITKVTFPVTREMGADDQETFRIPVVLREAYRDVSQPIPYETNQDAPLSKDVEGAGAFVLYEDENGEEQKTEALSPELTVYPHKTDYTVEKKALKEQVKAGEEAVYEVTVENTGGRDLQDITLTDVFEKSGVDGRFVSQDGLEVSEDGAQAVIRSLPRGQRAVLQVQARIPQEEEGQLTNKVTASVLDPADSQQNIVREATEEIQVEAAVLDYTVEKTADKTQAAPGDTICYEITIENTGERTLNSVVTTDQFQAEGVQAVFQEQEGVSLNEEGNQAYVDSIEPGAKVVLEAKVKLPEDFDSQELINMAVVSVEGENKKEDEASVKVAEKTSSKATPTPRAASRGTAAGSSSQKASAVKTGDDSRAEFFFLLALGCAAAGGGAFFVRRHRKVEK